jgi:drug/metabolite transporter (DMT)-like permease
VVYLHEPVQIWLILSIGLMLVAILVGAWRPSKTEAERSRRELPTGVLLGAASMIAVSASVVFAKPVYLRVDLWWASTVRILGGMAFLAVHGLLPAHRSAVRACFRPNRTWRVAIPAALLGAYLAMFFWIAGMRYTYAATAAVINQLSTIFILILATIALGEPLTARKCLAVLLAAAAAVMAIV